VRASALRGAAVVALAAACLSACVPKRPAPAPSTHTIVSRVTSTVPPPPVPSYTPPPAHAVAGLPPGQRPPAGQVEKPCPYIASSARYYNDPRPSVADIVGSHVLRTTVLTATSPAGCRFYFYSGRYQAIADIVPHRFASDRAAYAALVATGEAGGEAAGHPNLVPGVDAVLYRTRFFAPDGARDWACAFAAGSVLVVVHTQRNDTSFSALELARTIAPKFATS
jgi:hypothetical protein